MLSILHADSASNVTEAAKNMENYKALAEAVSGASGISIAISVFSVIGTIVIGLSSLPQTIKTMKDKDTANISFLLFFLTGVATFFLTLYGIGLVTVPQNSWNFLVDVGTGPGGKAMFIFNNQEWTAGFLVPGILLIIGEFFASITSFMVAFVKLNNKLKAQKAGLSEAEYYDKFIKPTLKIKGGN